MELKIIVEDMFLNLAPENIDGPMGRKTVLGLANDYEDGDWRYASFQDFIWDNVAETALSAQEREKLVNRSQSTLRAAARNLRLTDATNDISKGSELAEIILYGVLKHHYGALPVVPKIFYKQNAQDNAKGADSVHIVVDAKNDFSLWFGEAKFYNSIDDARLASVVSSVGEALKTEKLKKENSIVTNVRDIDGLGLDEGLRNRIRAALSNKSSIDELKPRIHIPILLLYECKITAEAKMYNEQYVSEVKSYHINRAASYFLKQAKDLSKLIHLYEQITFHLILIPVPNKKSIVDKFIEHASHYKNGGK
jgi:hypothetical protein